ncbi:MAG: SPFH domain-containing protein [Armatimonadetes bacterium]|nr:SPFH domain-containing protein [Armatimonadota bacterium]NOG38893.1 SPFH domain-containing protein [Armatimonadota bacterium]GIK32875.1 MAG: membrane protein [Armatimonadota bacterium]
MSHEKTIHVPSGWPMLFFVIALLGLGIYGVFFLVGLGESHPMLGWAIGGEVLLWLFWAFLTIGFFIVEPNGSKVMLLFGRYVGTVKDSGFHWANPLYLKRPLSLRVRTLNGEKLKVNDLAGNPVEIAAIIVWRVTDTFDASFEVDDYEEYVALQSETAVRHTTSSYPYDAEDEQLSLRRNTDEVSQDLRTELQERLGRAGVEVIEARLSHLAYAPEIAGAMLRRQQASAVIAARQRIVEGAVGMVEMALKELEKGQILTLDDERRAAMVSNLLVVLCGEQAASPVVNTGTLYS